MTDAWYQLGSSGYHYYLLGVPLWFLLPAETTIRWEYVKEYVYDTTIRSEVTTTPLLEDSDAHRPKVLGIRKWIELLAYRKQRVWYPGWTICLRPYINKGRGTSRSTIGRGVASLKHAFETVQLQGMPFLSCFRACTARRLLLYRTRASIGGPVYESPWNSGTEWASSLTKKQSSRPGWMNQKVCPSAWRPGPSLSTGHNSYRTLPPDALSLIRMSEHVCLLTSPLQSAPLLSGLPALRLTYLLYWEPAQLLGNLLGKVPLSLMIFSFWGFFRAIPSGSGSGPGFGLRALVQA